MYEVEVREQPEQHTAVLRGTVERDVLASWLSTAFGTVAAHLQRVGVPIVGVPFARFERRGGSTLQVEAGLPTIEVVDGKDQIEPGSLPGGEVAVVWHDGPLTALEPAYEALETWVARTGVRPLGPAWELHHGDPGVAQDDSSVVEVVQPFRDE